jgi:hypothetical protein
MSGYIRVLLKEFYTAIKLDILECHRLTYIDDDLIDKLLQPPKEDIEVYEQKRDRNLGLSAILSAIGWKK